MESQTVSIEIFLAPYRMEAAMSNKQTAGAITRMTAGSDFLNPMNNTPYTFILKCLILFRKIFDGSFQKLDFTVRGTALSKRVNHVDKSRSVLERVQVFHDRIILQLFQCVRRILVLVRRELEQTRNPDSSQPFSLWRPAPALARLLPQPVRRFPDPRTIPD